MLVVETIAKIRRAHLVQGKKIKEICRELEGLSEGGAQGPAIGRDVVQLRAFGAADAQARNVDAGAGRMLAANEARPSASA